jgi:hypothetical protein
MCIAYQLKQANYRKIQKLMKWTTFELFNQMLYLHVAGGAAIESFIGTEMGDVNKKYNLLINAIKDGGDQLIKNIEGQLRSGWGWFAYTPPESRGALIRSIADVLNQPRYVNNYDLRKSAAFSIDELLSTTQSNGHLVNTLDRIDLVMGNESGRNQGIQIINSVVEGTKFENCVERCSMQVAQAAPLLGRTFLRNDEPEFALAQFPLHHPGYAIA